MIYHVQSIAQCIVALAMLLLGMPSWGVGLTFPCVMLRNYVIRKNMQKTMQTHHYHFVHPQAKPASQLPPSQKLGRDEEDENEKNEKGMRMEYGGIKRAP